jgi:hypothetical protein
VLEECDKYEECEGVLEERSEGAKNVRNVRMCGRKGVRVRRM